MIELLSPVGNMKCLKAAINAGCDAVYLSGINFGARAFALNFSNDEILDAIKICHLYGVKVYITVNTLIYDTEVDRFIEYIDFLHKANVDAVIMQDIGMIDLVHKLYPNLEIHASTQLNIHNLEGVKFCEKIGIKRVVLARETPIELVKEIKSNTNSELEIFVHGALCMSYSGQCLMSSLIGGRSGNRGTCAQPCRKAYDLIINDNVVDKDKYLLSTKDLNTLSYLNELIDIGVNSIKIEGRMKRPEYVYLMTSIYRKAIDNYVKFGNTNISCDDIKNLKKVFNRKFTKGFLFNEDNDNFTNTFRPNHLGINIGTVLNYKNGLVTIKLTDSLNINDGIRIIGTKDVGMNVTTFYLNGKIVTSAKKGDIVSIPIKDKTANYSKNDIIVKTTDYNLMKKINLDASINKKINISGSCTLKIGRPIKLIINDGINTVSVCTNYIVEKSDKSETTEERIREQLNKLGNTIYKLEFLNIDKDSNIFVPINVLNELRREIIRILDEKRIGTTNYVRSNYNINVHNYKKENKKSILIHSIEDFKNYCNDYDRIYVDSKDVYNKINDSRCVLKLARVLEHFPNYNQKLLVGELGSVYKYKNVDTDFSLNVVNSYSVALLHSIGVNKITLSYELSYKQIKNLIDIYQKRYNAHPNLEVIIDANEEVMVCKYNMLKKYNSNIGYLRDKFGNNYKLEYKDNIMYVYNYKRRNLKENYFEIGVNHIRVNI